MRLRLVVLALGMALAHVLTSCSQPALSVRSLLQQHTLALAIPSPERAGQTVAVLADEFFGGRRAGTDGAAKAAEWIAREFQDIGLEPAGTDGYMFPFTFIFAEHTAMPELQLQTGNSPQWQYREDFAATMVSGSGEVEAEVVFVGYAMVAPELNYDDFAGLDLAGKIALVVRGAPGVGAEVQPEHRTQQTKDANVATHGGVGILYVSRPQERRGDELRLKHGVFAPVALPALEISPEVASTFVDPHDLDTIVGEIDRRRRPRSVATGQWVRLKTEVEVDYQRIDRNVLGLLPGKDPTLRDRLLIIGAHYDHMGTDVDGAIFRGAYDNASGVAALLEVARALAFDPPRFSVLFAAWGAEESGMVGSRAYRNWPGFEADKLVGVINLDSIGKADTLLVELNRTDKDAPRIMSFARQLGVGYREVGRLGPSDGLTFADLPIPVIQLADKDAQEHIHTLNDQSELLRSERLVHIAQMVALQTWWWSHHFY